MACRPIFLPASAADNYVRVIDVTFTWHAGLSRQQKQRSISSFHEAARSILTLTAPFEISTKSECSVGRALSAFNLSFQEADGRSLCVESLFQGSKVFESGGPYRDLYGQTGGEAKADLRLKTSGALREFQLRGVTWSLDPPTAFYDWVYLNVLMRNSSLREALPAYDGFTDIEFNPSRSVSCQARSAALYVALLRAGKLESAMRNRDEFLINAFPTHSRRVDGQLSIF
jgi:hypothetical protein